MRLRGWMAVGATVLGAAACGGGSGGDGGGAGQTCTPQTTAALSITATGLTPQNVCVRPNGTVTFTNADAAAHDIVFEVTGCPTVGSIAPGANVQATFPTTQNCTFHDNLNPSNTAYRGTVAVNSGVVTAGPTGGY